MINPAKLAICALAKDEAPYIEEWVAFHFLQGANDILIFDNKSTDGMRDILARVARHLPVEALDWPDGQTYDEMQRAAYREGTKRLAGNADWVAFIDIDEFLFSSRGKSLPEELSEFGHEVGAIAVGHRIFGSSGLTHYQPDLVTSRFVRCAKPDHPQSRWFKTIARPTCIEAFDSVHSVVLNAGSYLRADGTPLCRENPDRHPGYADRVGNGPICLFHYMVKSREEYLWKRLRFRGKLEHRYNEHHFREHDEAGNEMTYDGMRRFAEPIRAMISRWR